MLFSTDINFLNAEIPKKKSPFQVATPNKSQMHRFTLNVAKMSKGDIFEETTSLEPKHGLHSQILGVVVRQEKKVRRPLLRGSLCYQSLGSAGRLNPLNASNRTTHRTLGCAHPSQAMQGGVPSCKRGRAGPKGCLHARANKSTQTCSLRSFLQDAWVVRKPSQS